MTHIEALTHFLNRAGVNVRCFPSHVSQRVLRVSKSKQNPESASIRKTTPYID